MKQWKHSLYVLPTVSWQCWVVANSFLTDLVVTNSFWWKNAPLSFHTVMLLDCMVKTSTNIVLFLLSTFHFWCGIGRVWWGSWSRKGSCSFAGEIISNCSFIKTTLWHLLVVIATFCCIIQWRQIRIRCGVAQMPIYPQKSFSPIGAGKHEIRKRKI